MLKLETALEVRDTENTSDPTLSKRPLFDHICFDEMEDKANLEAPYYCQPTYFGEEY
jgi:hypothetical protein